MSVKTPAELPEDEQLALAIRESLNEHKEEENFPQREEYSFDSDNDDSLPFLSPSSDNQDLLFSPVANESDKIENVENSLDLAKKNEKAEPDHLFSNSQVNEIVIPKNRIPKGFLEQSKATCILRVCILKLFILSYF